MDSEISKNTFIELAVDYWNTIEYEIISDNRFENESNSSECSFPSNMKNYLDKNLDGEEKFP